MTVLNVNGGKPLNGTVRVHGAKNSVLPILAATLLGKGVCVINNCPDLADVHSTLRILRHLGADAVYSNGVVTVDASFIKRVDIPETLMREMRSSVIFLGAILARTGEVEMSHPGGCELGPRPIDIHLAALRQLGAEISDDCGFVRCRAKKLVGNDITLSFPSVGATENAMIASCSCNGVTIIRNAAREPEIEDLQNFLRAIGADVSGAGSSTVTIKGGGELHGAVHRVIPDRIVTATYLSAAAIAGGKIRVEDTIPEHSSAVLSILAEAGCDILREPNALELSRYRPLRPMRPVRTMPYPGFPTDAQSPIMAVCTKAEGTTVFVENIFSSRFRHVGELARMGADIRVEGRVAIVCGVSKLFGARVECTDLRGGAALAVAAIGADGVTSISELQHIDRGYENLVRDFSYLGVDIKRVEE